jgi:hypothetical protein
MFALNVLGIGSLLEAREAGDAKEAEEAEEKSLA